MLATQADDTKRERGGSAKSHRCNRVSDPPHVRGALTCEHALGVNAQVNATLTDGMFLWVDLFLVLPFVVTMAQTAAAKGQRFKKCSHAAALSCALTPHCVSLATGRDEPRSARWL